MVVWNNSLIILKKITCSLPLSIGILPKFITINNNKSPGKNLKEMNYCRKIQQFDEKKWAWFHRLWNTANKSRRIYVAYSVFNTHSMYTVQYLVTTGITPHHHHHHQHQTYCHRIETFFRSAKKRWEKETINVSFRQQIIFYTESVFSSFFLLLKTV